ncbi:HlyD family type I secretion periplasmic adaptor subunit [Seohaeicola zhoushanensis]|uniref:Membrane fusion protein (MFP) family protein n=1 Tax=Seohaeicola zhoushanensis TaxID=1569283 RepID=A0A8J3M9N5_9RHOB|nr:HlyD family type I secretion periplasmic adaptor subunit [Seohaeicola zhoushanensis]GHF69163.1 HlyD family type I secretion periplasmic adaptor subunit [Seohaeicola zhoushanensis]
MSTALDIRKGTELSLPNTLPQSGAIALAPPTRIMPLVLGLILATLLFWGGLVFWAAWTPIASAVIAPGAFKVEGSLPVIQHLEGGLVRKVNVREGERVAAGQVLLELADTMPGAQDRILANQLVAALAQDQRLAAEFRDDPEITMSDELRRFVASDPSFAEIVQTQTELFQSNNAMWQGQFSILSDRYSDQENQLAGMNSRLDALNQRLAIVQDELNGLESLFAKNLITKDRLLSRRDAEVALIGDVNVLSAQMDGLEERMSETRERMLQVKRDRARALSEQRQQVKSLLFDIRQRIIANEDVRRRLLVRAPAAGRVIDLGFTAPGEVIRPGEDILKIVPEGASYVVEGQIRPEDVDQVQEGDKARVRLTAYNFRTTPPVEGEVSYVSADSFTDNRTGGTFFKVHVRVSDHALDNLPGVEIAPGMPAQVMIATGEQTVVNYLMGPIIHGIETAMRESD